MREAYLGLRRQWSEVLRQFDLSLSEIGVLDLCAGAPAKVSGVARAVGLTPAGGTDVIDRLERRQLVRRVPHSVDRRVVHVRLTPAGLRLHREARSARRDVLHDVGRAMTEDERRALAVGLEGLLGAMRRRGR